MITCAHSKIMALCLLIALPSLALAGEPIWIDVRSAGEYSEGHVSLAVNIPYEKIAAGIETLTNDKDAPIYVYCRSGRRSGIAKETLENLGYSQVINLGGLDHALEKSGQEIAH